MIFASEVLFIIDIAASMPTARARRRLPPPLNNTKKYDKMGKALDYYEFTTIPLKHISPFYDVKQYMYLI